MKKELYDLLDWGRIEGIVYSEENQPHSFLGASVTKDGVLIQAFFPMAKSVKLTGRNLSAGMELVDENGFFAALLPGKKIPEYRFEVAHEDGTVRTVLDPYNYEPLIPEKILKNFLNISESEKLRHKLVDKIWIVFFYIVY